MSIRSWRSRTFVLAFATVSVLGQTAAVASPGQETAERLAAEGSTTGGLTAERVAGIAGAGFLGWALMRPTDLRT